MGIEKKAEKSGIAQHGGKESEMKRRKEKERKKHWSVAQQRPVTASTSAQIGPSQGLQNDSTP